MRVSIIQSEELSDIVTISKRSAHAKTEICIFELGSLDQLIGMKTAEDIRHELHQNKVLIRQLTNHAALGAWTATDGLVQDSMQIRYLDPTLFTIQNEILVFDDTVAMYRVQPDVSYVEIQDAAYATMMRDFFNSMWGMSKTMRVTADGSANAT